MKCLAYLLFVLVQLAQASKVSNIYWNTTNEIFHQANEAYVVDVNKGNLPWEYDQINIICPVYKEGSGLSEQHTIYSVSEEEYRSCRVTNPRPKIVAVCNKPQSFRYFTITFRSFSPSPRQLEFTPGRSYYFISTANNKDIHRRVGGWCSSHNMKLVFKVAERPPAPEVSTSTTTRPSPVPASFWSSYWKSSRIPDYRDSYSLHENLLDEDEAAFREAKWRSKLKSRLHNAFLKKSVAARHQQQASSAACSHAATLAVLLLAAVVKLV